jgi:hypothetical protein
MRSSVASKLGKLGKDRTAATKFRKFKKTDALSEALAIRGSTLRYQKND